MGRRRESAAHGFACGRLLTVPAAPPTLPPCRWCLQSERSRSAESPSRAAVIVAHPGHELGVYHWMEHHRPLYCCLTDGSGGRGRSRVLSTAGLLETVHASPGPIYGRYADREVYRLLLDGRVDVFVGLVEELAEALLGADVECVVGDAVEGFNPAHDVCRFLVDGAVAKVRRRTGRVIANYEFALDHGPGDGPESSRGEAIWLCLDEPASARKLAAALEYPELRDEVRVVLERFGPRALTVECLRPAATRLMLDRFEKERPTYEASGAYRVSQGVYTDVIRYRQHVLPALTAIERANRDERP